MERLEVDDTGEPVFAVSDSPACDRGVYDKNKEKLFWRGFKKFSGKYSQFTVDFKRVMYSHVQRRLGFWYAVGVYKAVIKQLIRGLEFPEHSPPLRYATYSPPANKEQQTTT